MRDSRSDASGSALQTICRIDVSHVFRFHQGLEIASAVEKMPQLILLRTEMAPTRVTADRCPVCLNDEDGKRWRADFGVPRECSQERL